MIRAADKETVHKETSVSRSSEMRLENTQRLGREILFRNKM